MAQTASDLEAMVRGIAEDKNLELRLWLRLLSTTKLITQEIRRRLRAEFGATLPQFDLMAQLQRARDGLRLGELSKRTMVTNGNITGLISRLEAEGLVVRQTTSDRRVTIAKLSPRGVARFTAMAKVHERWLMEIMADIDPEIMALLLDNMALIKASVQRHTS